MSESQGRPYAGQSADERDAQRRARLLAATRELIGTKGYAATKIDRICALANVSTRHFYRQYDGKESAFIDLYDQLTSESYERVLESLQHTEGRPLAERVTAGFSAYLQPMFDDVRTARIAFVEVIGVSPRIEQLRLEYREVLISVIEAEGTAAVTRGEVADRDFRFASLALIGAANVIVHDWAIKADRLSAKAVQQKLVALAVDLLAG
ncbi:MAG TPA: TetR/AcrR family transcriptional regulator [Nocardioidaceae bacterium]|nr:TetR/AcrR family transcriptional regulator [Nocardioidaceae bacterium]